MRKQWVTAVVMVALALALTVPAWADCKVQMVLKSSVLGASGTDRKSTRLNSSHTVISYAVFCLKKKKHQKFHLLRNDTKQLDIPARNAVHQPRYPDLDTELHLPAPVAGLPITSKRLEDESYRRH